MTLLEVVWTSFKPVCLCGDKLFPVLLVLSVRHTHVQSVRPSVLPSMSPQEDLVLNGDLLPVTCSLWWRLTLQLSGLPASIGSSC